MGLFSRLGDIINSNLNTILDNAENPEKIARLMIQEMEDTLVEVRTAAARSMADKKELEREIAHYQHVCNDWQCKAGLALDKNREDLARAALTARKKAEQEISCRQDALDAAREAFDQRQDDLSRLAAKLDEAKARHRALMLRRETAQQRIRVRSHTYDSRVDDALARYASVERKVDEMEAYADTIRPGETDLHQAFADLEQGDEIEAELTAMKKSRTRSPVDKNRPDTGSATTKPGKDK